MKAIGYNMHVNVNFDNGLLYTITLVLITQTYGHFEYNAGSHVTLNPKLLSWQEAATECEETNGTLLTITDVATMFDLGLTGRWIIWVGLVMNGSSGQWQSGLPVTWTNRKWSDKKNTSGCVSLETTFPFWWEVKDCLTRLPSLCETKSGTHCEFQETTTSSLIGFANSHLVGVGYEICQAACVNAANFICKSFEYNEKRKFCELSNSSRWEHPGRFTSNDKEWSYYHMDCYNGDWNDSLIPNGFIPSTIPTTQVVTERICYSPHELMPNENQTKQIETVIQELQSLEIKYKDRRRSLTKESTVDYRPSATYVGSVAMVILTTLLGGIVVLDVLSLSRKCTKRCCNKNKKRSKVVHKTKTCVNLDKGRSVFEARRRMLQSLAKGGIEEDSIPDDYSDSSTIEISDTRISLPRITIHNHTKTSTDTSEPEVLEPGNSSQSPEEPICLNSEIEVDDAFNTNSTTKEDYSFVNTAYVNISPVISPFHRASDAGVPKTKKQNNLERRSVPSDNFTQEELSNSIAMLGSSYYNVWPHENNRFRKNSNHSDALQGVGKFILAYGKDFHKTDDVESFRC